MATYFAMFYASINFGSLISTVATPLLRYLSQWRHTSYYPATLETYKLLPCHTGDIQPITLPHYRHTNFCPAMHTGDIQAITLLHRRHTSYYHSTLETYKLLPCHTGDKQAITLPHCRHTSYYPATLQTYKLLPCHTARRHTSYYPATLETY